MKYLIYSIILLVSFNTFSATSEWGKVLDQDDIQVFSGDMSQSGIIPFKAVARISSPLKVILNVLLHNNRKTEWAPKLDKAIVHQKLSNNKYVFSEFYKTPWPATDREFLLTGEIKIINPKLVYLNATSLHNEKLKSLRHIQTDVKYMNLTLKQISNSETLMEFTFQGDMKGWMPVWLMNLIQKKWPLRFVQGLRKQVKRADLTVAPAFQMISDKL